MSTNIKLFLYFPIIRDDKQCFVCVYSSFICVLFRNVDWVLCSFENGVFKLVRSWASCVFWIFWILVPYLVFNGKYFLNSSGSYFHSSSLSFAKHKPFYFIVSSLFIPVVSDFAFCVLHSNFSPPQCNFYCFLKCCIFNPCWVDSYIKGETRV